MNWSSVAHCVGNMHDEEELQSVRVRLPDGSTVEPARMERDSYGHWLLVVEEPGAVAP